MARTFSTQMHFPVDAMGAYALVTDPDYARTRAERTAGRDVEVAVEGDPATVVSRRTLPVPDQLPSFAKAMVGGNGIRVEETHSWQSAAADGAREATLTVLFPAMPVRVNGTMTITPAGADACTVTIEGTVQATMPMVGSVVEQGVMEQVLRAADLEQALAVEWVRGS